MKTLFAVAFAFIVFAGFQSVAFAQTEHNQRARLTMEAAGVNVVGIGVAHTVRGDRMVIKSTQSANLVVANLREHHRVGRLFDGHRVIGVARVPKHNAWVFTLEDENRMRVTVKVKATAEGTDIIVGRRHASPRR